MGSFFHLCDVCLNYNKCPMGQAVNDGVYDEYITDQISDDFEYPSNFKAHVAITQCESFRGQDNDKRQES